MPTPFPVLLLTPVQTVDTFLGFGEALEKRFPVPEAEKWEPNAALGTWSHSLSISFVPNVGNRCSYSPCPHCPPESVGKSEFF